MGTWAAIFIKTNGIDLVKQKLQALSGIDDSYKGDFPTSDLYDHILLDDNAEPTYFVFAQTQVEWVMVRHNALKNLEEWGKELSNDLQTEVVIASAQGNAGFYHFSLYRRGEMVREIEYCYGADYEPINIGDRFEFEDEQPGKKVEYNGEVDFIFDFDSIEEYSKQFGLEVQPDYDNIQEWEILKSITKQKTLGDFRLRPKPWWKICVLRPNCSS
jgi:hypothetical protein